MSEQMATQSLISERQQLAQRLGLRFGGTRDVYAEAGYPDRITPDDYVGRYRRDPIARRIVDMPVQATWRRTPIVTEVERPDASPFAEQVVQLAHRLTLWRQLERVDRLSRLGRYGVLLIGVAEPDGGDLGQPLPPLMDPSDVLYLTPLSERHAQIERLVSDPQSPRYGLPERYRLRLSTEGSGLGSHRVIAHHSRVIHVAEDLLEDLVGIVAIVEHLVDGGEEEAVVPLVELAEALAIAIGDASQHPGVGLVVVSRVGGGGGHYEKNLF